MDPLSIITLVAGAAGSMITIVTFLTLVCKPLRERFVKWVRKITNKDDMDKEINSINEKIDKITLLVEKTIEQNEKLQEEMQKQSKALLSDTRKIILDMCTKIYNRGYMTMYESETLSALYDSYDALNGNTFVHGMVKNVFTNIPVKKSEGGD